MMTGSDRRIYLIFIVLALMLACKDPVSKQPLNNWKLIPEDIVNKAATREYKLLFGVDR